MRRHSNSPHVKAKNAAWKSFALWVRTKEKICFTCDSEETPQAGHWIHKDCLDFEEMNIHRQCARCNLWLHGNAVEYTLRMIDKYGKKKVEELKNKGFRVRKFTIEELEKIKIKYDKKYKKLKLPEK